MGFYKNTE